MTLTLTLALQPLVHRVYDRARLGLAIDYGQPLTPQLSEADAAWIAELVQRYPSRAGHCQWVISGWSWPSSWA